MTTPLLRAGGHDATGAPRSMSAGGAAPAWVRRADEALASAISTIRVIASATPRNARAELDRLRSAWAAGNELSPAWVYGARGDHHAARQALDRLGRLLEGEGELGRLYAARARELEEEGALCEAVGGLQMLARSRARYARRDAFDEEADALARAWASAPAREAARRDIQSDDPRDRRSLLARMCEEVGRHRLPLRVVASPDLAALAATGDRAIFVVAGCMLTRRDVERTVVHEIAGHALPRARASTMPVGLFGLGTARGSDDQEGRALSIERARGLLDAERRAELGRRHLSARLVHAGADFVQTVRMLRDLPTPVGDAVRIAARAHRGGGLAREVVYLPGLLRVLHGVQERPELDRVLACGRVSVDAACVLLRLGYPPAAE